MLRSIYKKIRHIYRKIIYYGNKHKCNICGSKVKKIIPGGIKHEIFEKNKIVEAGYRENCFCPVCKSRDRIRIIYYYIENYTNILTDKNCILHFAPEYQLKEKIIKNKKIDYYDGDIKEGRATYVVDIRNIQFSSNKFDYIICNQVLEHIVEEAEAINELKRVIKPNGKIIITVPICLSNEKTYEDLSITDPEERLKNFCQKDHVRLYGRDFKERLEKYGLKVEEWKIKEHVTEDEIQKYAFQKDSVIFIATK